MTKFKSKLIISAIVFVLAIISMQLSIYATNENIEIVKKSVTDYLIYVENVLEQNFEFAFSKDKNQDKATLIFKKSETDSSNEDANKIAYINSTTIDMFENTTYMWVKDENDKYIIDGVEVDLSLAIDDESLDAIANITKIIPVDTTKTNTDVVEENGKTITTTVGKVILPETAGNYEYLIVELPSSEEYNKFMSLATIISKFNSETDMYTKISVYKEFKKLETSLKPNVNDSKWKKAIENEINQPVDAENGTQYVLWLRENNGNNSKHDVQFLTSTKEVSEEKIIEKITTKLPVTYDNNTLLIVLAILVVLTIVVSVRIKVLSKKEMQD